MAIGAVLGLVIGSFLAVLTGRWPQGLAITGRSRCDGCGVQLGVAELVPLLSFIALRGRCRHCAAAIAPRHLAIELAAAVVGAVMLWRYPLLPGLVAAGAGWWLLALIVLDAEHQWLPDRLTLPLIPAGLLLGHWLGYAPLGDRALAALLGFGTLAALRLGWRLRTGREGMGGGDPKLFAGIGALVGVLPLPFLLTGAALLGLVLALADALRGRAVTATTALPFGALLAGMALILLMIGPNWWEMLR
ncbi:MAG: A24 family peptidase [Alphaproteobacteria bacterium]|nr:A24 family peptidase [Alphaproteobacteria bacterium]